MQLPLSSDEYEAACVLAGFRHRGYLDLRTADETSTPPHEEAIALLQYLRDS